MRCLERRPTSRPSSAPSVRKGLPLLRRPEPTSAAQPLFSLSSVSVPPPSPAETQSHHGARPMTPPPSNLNRSGVALPAEASHSLLWAQRDRAVWSNGKHVVRKRRDPRAHFTRLPQSVMEDHGGGAAVPGEQNAFRTSWSHASCTAGPQCTPSPPGSPYSSRRSM